MRLFKTVAGLRAELACQRSTRTIGLVPTMGALHAGHMSLIKRAIAENDLVVVSIFVNPLQFGPKEDFQNYPRSLDEDSRLCEQVGVDILFAPTLEEMKLPQGDRSEPSTTTVVPPATMMSGLCGPFRPGHFPGVATIVTKLLNIVQPTIAYFGEKDAQQLAIIRALVKDLDLPVTIRGCSIIRELSGLAYSSRNQYLTKEEKKQALALSRGLRQAQKAFRAGERDASYLIAIVKQELTLVPEIQVQYVELVDPQTLEPLERIETAGLLAIAAYVGSTRLIDNVILRLPRQPIIAIDGPAGAGKSTVTRQIAQRLGFMYLDSGAMYRAVTWLVMQSGIAIEDAGAIAELVSGVTIELIPSRSPDLPTQVQINGIEVTEAIRTPEVTTNVSTVSAQAAVRQALVRQQQRYGEKGGIVAEGRDIGTKVFPDAELKIFLTASAQERAKRRLQDLKEQGEKDLNLEQLEQDIQRRDHIDSNRQISPLQQAADAIEVNTDGLSVEEVTEQIINLYRQRLSTFLNSNALRLKPGAI